MHLALGMLYRVHCLKQEIKHQQGGKFGWGMAWGQKVGGKRRFRESREVNLRAAKDEKMWEIIRLIRNDRQNIAKEILVSRCFIALRVFQQQSETAEERGREQRAP